MEVCDQLDEDAFEGLQAVICRFPYNLLLIAVLPNLEQGFLRLQYMSHFVEVLSSVMDFAEYEPLFCSVLQLK